MVTLKTIAKECGLSTTAVSKALRNEKDISPTTIQKVNEVAKQLGYYKNRAAVNLKTRKSNIIGVLMQDDTQSGVTHELFANILNSAMFKARDCGYSLLFVMDKLGDQQLSYVEYVKAHGCDGVLVLVEDFNDEKTLELAKLDIPLISIDYVYQNRGAIISDNSEGMAKMVEYAYEQGHRKIAFIHGEVTNVTNIRLASFHTACEKLGIEIPQEYLKQGQFHDPESAERCTYELLDLSNPPTFIFYQDDFAFIGGLNALENRNLSYPKDISVAGYDGMMLTSVIKPNLMTWEQNTKQLGQQAVEQLIEAIESPKTYIPRVVEVKGKLNHGQSVKKIN